MKRFLIKERHLTKRPGHLPIEGGGLNASYTTVDAVAHLCSMLGNQGLRYGKDYIWEGTDYDDQDDEVVTILMKPNKEKHVTALGLKLNHHYKIKHTINGEVKLEKEKR